MSISLSAQFYMPLLKQYMLHCTYPSKLVQIIVCKCIQQALPILNPSYTIGTWRCVGKTVNFDKKKHPNYHIFGSRTIKTMPSKRDGKANETATGKKREQIHDHHLIKHSELTFLKALF